jgi:hypothetical protein
MMEASPASSQYEGKISMPTPAKLLFTLGMIGGLIVAPGVSYAGKGGGYHGGGSSMIYIPPSGGGGGGWGGYGGGGYGGHGGGDSGGYRGQGGGGYVRDGGGDTYVRQGGRLREFSTGEFGGSSGRRTRQSLLIPDDGETRFRKHHRFDGKIRDDGYSGKSKRHWVNDDDKNGHKHERHRRRHKNFQHFYNGWWYEYPWWLYGAYASDYYGYYDAHVEWCLRNYRSYNIRTNSYVTKKGKRRECISPYV